MSNSLVLMTHGREVVIFTPLHYRLLGKIASVLYCALKLNFHQGEADHANMATETCIKVGNL